ncbi:hypothetical protein IEU95_08210 [Hoyosella rhizosphaerae]|uniref:Uncharacterized protein n=1 Tax=Hoyosella rhizosphaerae TaxID=1755582 RepID=A0A916U0Y1_9ACTN|nr:hypothetical protein [Hoyosella rhizosphaerae]MBN4926811.1 hypothetical protein [Hoyosella rhizosphaerae]GGC56280.1 hypothetical protein GCM10011410_05930 [Hoyosella rhizosphaerae]
MTITVDRALLAHDSDVDQIKRADPVLIVEKPRSTEGIVKLVERIDRALVPAGAHPCNLSFGISAGRVAVKGATVSVVRDADGDITITYLNSYAESAPKVIVYGEKK